MNLDTLDGCIRDIPDFPKPGVVFKDITPLLSDSAHFRFAVACLAERITELQPDALVGVESRGFIFASALAHEMQLPLELVRKPGKLPHQTVSVTYQLEYGEETLEAHDDAFTPGRRYVVIDDLLATGGTAAAACQLIEAQGGVIACCAFVIELAFLGGRDRLPKAPVISLLNYNS